MILTIKKVYTKPIRTEYGDKIKVGLITEEYGDKVWVNSLMSTCELKDGDIIEADVKNTEKYGYEFTFKGMAEKKVKRPITKDDEIRFLNAINNAVLLAAHCIINFGEIEDTIDWLYRLEPPDKYDS